MVAFDRKICLKQVTPWKPETEVSLYLYLLIQNDFLVFCVMNSVLELFVGLLLGSFVTIEF